MTQPDQATGPVASLRFSGRRAGLVLACVLLSAQAPAPATTEQAPAAPGPVVQGSVGQGQGDRASAATGPIAVRTGTHPGFGRIVFDAPPKARFQLTRDGDQVTIRFPDGTNLGRPGSNPRNVSGLAVSGPRAVFTIAPGARIRELRLGQRIVFDVTDPPTVQAAAPRKPAAPPKPVAPRAEAPKPQAPQTEAKPQAAGAEAKPQAPQTEAKPQAAGAEAANKTEEPRPRRASAVVETRAKGGRPPPAVARPDAPAPGPTATSPAGEAVPAAPPPATPPATQILALTPAAPATSGPSGASVPSVTPAPRIPVVADPPPPPPGPAASDVRPTSPAKTPTAPPARPAQAASSTPPADLAEPEPRGPLALVARRLPTAPNVPSPTLFVPFSEAIGVALFQRETAVLAVFGERRPVDLTAVRDDPVFAAATIQLLPNATLLRLPLPPGQSAAISAGQQGWRVAVTSVTPPRQILRPSFDDGRVAFPTTGAAGVVTLLDPDTGATLLVGTVAKTAEAVTTERRTVEFNLPVTLRGIVVEPLSDAVSLRTVPKGFVLTGAPEGLALSPPSAMTNTKLAAARLTRRFRLPAMPVDGLSQRVLAHVQEAASMPPLARGPARKVAAETMVALGMAAEADALLRVISEQDPNEAASPDTVILKAIAALLAGRPQEARALADPRFGGTDEDALWRAILLATRQEGSPEASQLFASTAPLIALYPPTLRDRLLPLAVETMILGGNRAAAEEILADHPNDPPLRMATALGKQAAGDADGALALFDELAKERDQLTRARAAVRAVEVRLAKGEMETAAAADALDRLLYAWRGDWRDLSLRRRVAELRQQSGGWRAALAILRDARGAFPAYADQIRAWQQSTFAALVDGDDVDRLDPLELIGLVEENADLLPATEAGDRLRERLADRLLALELPGRADVVLTRLMQTAPTDLGRTAFGTRLARIRLREGDAEGALTALGQSANQDLPPPIREQRVLITAAALGRLGNPKGAMNALMGLDSEAADEARATILEQARDWGGAKRALASLVRRMVPPEGDLDDAQQRVLLRLATASARAGDEAMLMRLREKESVRMGDGPLGDMFRLLTADPVRGAADLSRAKQEIGLVRALPAGLKALDGGAGQP